MSVAWYLFSFKRNEQPFIPDKNSYQMFYAYFMLLYNTVLYYGGELPVNIMGNRGTFPRKKVGH
jgi:hypothetical protein